MSDNTWVFNALVALLVALLAGFVTHRFAMRRERLNAQRTAAAAFRTAILSALSGLYPEPVNWPIPPEDIDPVLRKLFPSLQAAVAQFRPFVSLWRRRAFDQTWFRYRCATGRSVDVQSYLHYMASKGTDAKGTFKDIDAKGNFRRNVDALLSFAR